MHSLIAVGLHVFDGDALPVEEKTGLPYASTVKVRLPSGQETLGAGFRINGVAPLPATDAPRLGADTDAVLAELFPEFSRSRLAEWIKSGDAVLDGRQVRSGRVLAAEFVNQNRAFRAVWFDGGDGKGYADKWIVYGKVNGEELFSAKELTVEPGTKITAIDHQAALLTLDTATSAAAVSPRTAATTVI